MIYSRPRNKATHIQLNLDLQTAVLLADLCWSILDTRLVDGYDAAAIKLLGWHLRGGHLRLLLILALEGLLVFAVALRSFVLGLYRLGLIRALFLLALFLSLASGRNSSADCE